MKNHSKLRRNGKTLYFKNKFGAMSYLSRNCRSYANFETFCECIYNNKWVAMAGNTMSLALIADFDKL